MLKNEKICWRYHYFTNVYQKSQLHDVRFLRYGVRQTEFFVILGHFLPFYHPHSHVSPNDPENQNFEKKRKNTWRYYQGRFLPLYPSPYPPPRLLDPENQNFEKMKKASWGIIILHLCAINDNRMIYGSWDMKGEGQNFFPFSTVFCPFTPVTNRKIKILKN